MHKKRSESDRATGASSAPQPPSWRWILIAKGIGILLVVIGHFNPPNSPAQWQAMVTLIYTFHMPLFMALSGYLYVVGKERWPALMASKFQRLGFPFIFVAILFLLIKLASQIFVELEHPFTPASFVELLVQPGKSYVPLLWFVHALFFMFALYPILHSILRSHWMMFLLFVLLSTFVSTPYAGINTIIHHFPFFIAGVWLRESGQLQLVQKRGWIRIASLGLLCFVVIYWNAPALDSANNNHYPWLLALGLSGMLTSIAISHRIDLAQSSLASVLASAGTYSMSIYLFHTLFESAVRVIGFQVSKVPDQFFLVVALLAIATGMFLPLLLEKHVLRRIGFTRKYLLGLK